MSEMYLCNVGDMIHSSEKFNELYSRKEGGLVRINFYSTTNALSNYRLNSTELFMCVGHYQSIDPVIHISDENALITLSAGYQHCFRKNEKSEKFVKNYLKKSYKSREEFAFFITYMYMNFNSTSAEFRQVDLKYVEEFLYMPGVLLMSMKNEKIYRRPNEFLKFEPRQNILKSGGYPPVSDYFTIVKF